MATGDCGPTSVLLVSLFLEPPEQGKLHKLDTLKDSPNMSTYYRLLSKDADFRRYALLAS